MISHPKTLVRRKENFKTTFITSTTTVIIIISTTTITIITMTITGIKIILIRLLYLTSVLHRHIGWPLNLTLGLQFFWELNRRS